MPARGKDRKPERVKKERKKRDFAVPGARTITCFRNRCRGPLPCSRLHPNPESRRRTDCVIWSGGYRSDRLRSDPRMIDGSGNFLPGIPYCGKTSARMIAYYVCSGGKLPPASYKGTHCHNPYCVNPWHVIWHTPTSPKQSRDKG